MGTPSLGLSRTRISELYSDSDEFGEYVVENDEDISDHGETYKDEGREVAGSVGQDEQYEAGDEETNGR